MLYSGIVNASNENETYRVAAALGQPLPAPLGAEVVVLTIINGDPTLPAPEILLTRVFPNFEQAHKSLTDWCISEWESRGSPPWEEDWHQNEHPNAGYEELKSLWISTYADLMATEYFLYSPIKYVIEAMRVESGPE